MKTLSIFLTIVVVSGGASAAGLLLVKRLFRQEHLEAHHPVANALLTVLGTLYSVVLGFLISAAASYQADVRSNLQMEANSLGNIFRLARGLEDGPRLAIRDTCRMYCRLVLEVEWDKMALNQTSVQAWEMYARIWDQILAVEPADTRQQNIQAALLNEAADLSVARRTRIAQMRFHTSPLLWTVLIFGSGLVVIFSYLFATEGHVLHALMSSFVTISLSLIMALFFFYTHPFRYELRVPPEAFQIESALFRAQDDRPSPYVKAWATPGP
jgi:hypothetical protein